MWNLCFQSSPAAVVQYFGWKASSDEEAVGSSVSARGLGKSGDCPTPTEVRVILPLLARSQICDALVSCRLQCYLSKGEFRRDWLWVGAQKRTQPMGLAWML